MPYYLNCSRCNKDNKYSSLGNPCNKCSGTGRDWREDDEVNLLHRMTGLGIDELKEKGRVELVDNYGELKVFIYTEEIPTCSISEEIEEIRKNFACELAVVPKQSQIFCKHEWKLREGQNIEFCSKCGKTRSNANSVAQEKSTLQYDSTLHDQRYYFPNRCYACEHYADTVGEPESGTDVIYCNIGGKVRVDTGCKEFKADITAECKSCWNLLTKHEGAIVRYSCALKGTLKSLVWGGCHEHVEKERTDEPLPATQNAISISKSFLTREQYPYDPTIRKPILDAMIEVGIRYAEQEEFALDKRCLTCVHERNIQSDYGSCDHHELAILCYSGSNPYGYDEKICGSYSRKPKSGFVEYPKVYIDVMAQGKRSLNDNYYVELRNMYCDVIEARNGRVVTTFSYSSRAPEFMQYSKEKNCILLFFHGEPCCEELSLESDITYEHPIQGKKWVDVDEALFFDAIDKVVSEQRKHAVYSGLNRNSCEYCKLVNRNSSYPEGSPTGLICTEKDIFVTANGCCDNFEPN
ncbi:hypothetical protein [Pseudoalteromonas byunsanensis]|uniref:Uncharacterized protein n=1 Tax=Pseudoalteromonas byunsanensis TaxID=327939 RepID=A0A1S1N8K9_9GAMM|nr:hypothetical protein [Pseudoalteromonas byunsanensis]OHU95694.1 hypothetical protein BIW53_07615 [Pseudoalteromonas byunsanensis]